MVADEVLGAREEQDGDFGEEVGEEIDRGLGVDGAEVGADGAVAFDPAGDLVRVDVEGVDDVLAAEVRGDARQVGRPVHAAGRVRVLEADVVHVVALELAFAVARGGELEQVLEDPFAVRVVDVALAHGELLLADAQLDLELVGDVAPLRDQALLQGELEVGVVLLGRRDPAVADEQAHQVPLVLGVRKLVAGQDVLCDVGNVLAGVRLSGDVDLAGRQARLDTRQQETHWAAERTSSCSYSGKRVYHFSRKVTNWSAMTSSSLM